MLGPYLNSRGTGGTKMSVNAYLSPWRHVQQGKTIENQFFIYGQNVLFFYFWLFEGPWGASKIRLGLSCFPAIHSPIFKYMWNKEAIWSELFRFNSKIWNKYFFFIWGGVLEALTSNPGLPNFQGSIRHHRAEKCMTREQNNQQFFIYGPQCDKNRIFGYSGGGGLGGS